MLEFIDFFKVSALERSVKTSAATSRRYLTPLTTRKPESWAVCPLRRDLTAWHHDMLRQLPVVETGARPLEDFLGDPPPRECIVRIGGRHFYVNPEGYSYARYAFEFEPQADGMGGRETSGLQKDPLATAVSFDQPEVLI